MGRASRQQAAARHASRAGARDRAGAAEASRWLDPLVGAQAGQGVGRQQVRGAPHPGAGQISAAQFGALLASNDSDDHRSRSQGTVTHDIGRSGSES